MKHIYGGIFMLDSTKSVSNKITQKVQNSNQDNTTNNANRSEKTPEKTVGSQENNSPERLKATVDGINKLDESAEFDVILQVQDEAMKNTADNSFLSADKFKKDKAVKPNDENFKTESQTTNPYDRLDNLKSKIMDESGSLNVQNITDMFSSGELAFEDLQQILGSKPIVEVASSNYIEYGGLRINRSYVRDMGSNGEVLSVYDDSADEKITEARHFGANERINCLKDYCINNDGSINADNMSEMFTRGDLSYDDIKDIFEANGETIHERSILNNKTFELSNGMTVAYSPYTYKNGEFDIKFKASNLQITDSNSGSNVVDASRFDTTDQICNADGTLNADKIGELFEAGRLGYHALSKLLDATEDRSFNFYATLQDGTVINGAGNNGFETPILETIDSDGNSKVYYNGVF